MCKKGGPRCPDYRNLNKTYAQTLDEVRKLDSCNKNNSKHPAVKKLAGISYKLLAVKNKYNHDLTHATQTLADQHPVQPGESTQITDNFQINRTRIQNRLKTANVNWDETLPDNGFKQCSKQEINKYHLSTQYPEIFDIAAPKTGYSYTDIRPVVNDPYNSDDYKKQYKDYKLATNKHPNLTSPDKIDSFINDRENKIENLEIKLNQIKNEITRVLPPDTTVKGYGKNAKNFTVRTIPVRKELNENIIHQHLTPEQIQEISDTKIDTSLLKKNYPSVYESLRSPSGGTLHLVRVKKQ